MVLKTSHGDVIHLGATELTFESIGGDEANASSRATSAPPGPRQKQMPVADDDPPLLMDEAPLRLASETPAVRASERSFGKAPGSRAALDPDALPLAVDEPLELGKQPGRDESARNAKRIEPSLDTLVGTTLGRYLVQAVIGRGHHGLVFRALDQQSKQQAALKVLNPIFPQKPAEMEKLALTMKAAAALRHPNLLPILGVGHAAQYTYIITRCVLGESLAQVVKRFGGRGGPDWQLALEVALQTARALEHVHAHEWAHRNLTPANILLRAGDAAVVVTDLGFSRALAGSFLRQAVKRDKVAAEVVYFPPEQTHTKPNLDIRSDLYSLGAILYEMLTGRPPFCGASPTETVARIRAASPENPRSSRPELPARFADAIMRLLTKKPEERFQTPAELMAALSITSPSPPTRSS